MDCWRGFRFGFATRRLANPESPVQSPCYKAMGFIVDQHPVRARNGIAAVELREAFGVRGAGSHLRIAPRLPIAPASWTDSKRFAWQLIPAGLLAVACAAASAAVPPAPLAYEMSAYELAPQFQPTERPWHARDLKTTLLARVAAEKQRREMDVYYYRIGYTMSYPLPAAARPSLKELPEALPKRAYPWLTWFSWDLEERWRLLEFALEALQRRGGGGFASAGAGGLVGLGPVQGGGWQRGPGDSALGRRPGARVGGHVQVGPAIVAAGARRRPGAAGARCLAVVRKPLARGGHRAERSW